MGSITDKVKGKAKQVAGSLTGDQALKNEGKVDELKGKIKGAADKVEQKVQDATNAVRHAGKRL